jgi:nucleotide-binding universal stress UspA family protein
VLLVNVLGPAGYRVPTAADDKDLEAAAAYLNKQGVRNSRRSITSDGRAADAILDVAREVDASLILLGLHQRPLIAKRVLGSTAQAVVLAAPCPVLIVPDVDQPGERPAAAEAGAPPLRSMGQTEE